MFSKFIVRHASRKKFSLPSVSFKYADNVVEENNENLPPMYPIDEERQTNSDKRGFKNKHITKEDKFKWHEQKKYVLKAPTYGNSERKDRQSYVVGGNDVTRNNYFKNFDKKNSRLEGKYEKFGNKKEKKKIYPKGEFIFGIHPLFLALKSQRREIYHIYYKDGLESRNAKIGEIIELANQRNLKFDSVSAAFLKNAVGEDRVHQGICCDVSPLAFEKLQVEHVLRKPKSEQEVDGMQEAQSDVRTPQLWLYMDRIQDPMNFGAILRSAYFMGVDKVLTSAEHSCRISGVVSKASAGVAEVLPIYQADDLKKHFKVLADQGWNLVSTAANEEMMPIPLNKFTPNKNTILAVGNEGLGISPDLQDMFTTSVTIQPGQALQAGIDSLNVSVATAVILYDITSKISLMKLKNVDR